MYNSLDNILKKMTLIEENVSLLMSKIFFYRNENVALHKRIAYLEKENESLRIKRDYTADRLRQLMEKFEEAGY